MEPVNMTEGKTWSSIDIYLFSNGQQYSPPRKYHLRSEELQWWGTTVTYLGRTHYGSGHSVIDLYTTDGVKINGPLDLINGAAYVAVEPPDTFIDTGYEDYLVRASRSWDKRLAQKSAINAETTGPQLNITTVDTIATIEKKPSRLCDKTTSSLKSQSTKSHQSSQRRVTLKQIQKKKLPDTHNAVLKKICAETDKIFLCPKKTLPRNEVSGSSVRNRNRLSIVSCKKNISKDQSICSKIVSSIKPDENQNVVHDDLRSDTKTSNGLENLQYPLISSIDSFEQKFSTKKNRIMSDTIPEDIQTVISLYQNKEPISTSAMSIIGSERIIDKSGYQENSEKQINDFKNKNSPSILQDASLLKVEQEVKDLSKIKPDIKYDHEENVCPVNNAFLKENKYSQLNIPPIENHRESKLEKEDTVPKSRLSDKQVTDEYIAYTNRGELVLLKFNIKVKDCKTIFNKDKSKNLELTTSLNNLLKTEKTSQVDIDVNFSSELVKKTDLPFIENKSLQSVLNKLYVEDVNQVDSTHPRIIILNCACRGFSSGDRRKDSTMCGCTDKEEKYDVNPKQKYNGAFPCCQCFNETCRTFKNNINSDSYSTKDQRPSVPKTNGSRVSYLAQKFENSDKIMPHDRKYSRNENQIQSVKPGLYDSTILEASVDHSVNEDVNSSLRSFSDKSIQTDWSNIILEARRHEGDNYTFHLPLLYVLKQYKL